MKKIYLLLSLSLLAPWASSGEPEFLHWWTSQGEQAALNVLTEHLLHHNVTFETSPVIGGGGDTAMTVLQARALAGNTPDFAQIEGGPSIKAWDAIGVVHSLNATAKHQQWQQHLYPLVTSINQTGNGYVALPLTLHRLNWLWVNHRLLSQLNLTVPDTWPAMIAAMHTAEQAGITPLAVGAEPWQIAQLFESLVIAQGGIALYRDALVDLKPAGIDSQPMRRALRQLREIHQIVGDDNQDTKWDSATRDLAHDKALFQIGGDWVLGELMALGVDVPAHIGCFDAPQSHHSFLYNMDSLIFMRGRGFNQQQANQLAGVLADSEFQRKFNLVKGSIPVRKDISIQGFNPCQQTSYHDFNYALEHNLTVPSMTDSMAVNPVAQQAINTEIFQYYRRDDITEDAVIQRIIAIAQSHE